MHSSLLFLHYYSFIQQQKKKRINKSSSCKSISSCNSKETTISNAPTIITNPIPHYVRRM